MTTALDFFNAARAYKLSLVGTALTQEDVDALNAATIGRWTLPVTPSVDAGARLTERGAMELVGHEAIVREWYKDSVGVGTWSVGITNASGHSVDRYKDNPQTIMQCLEIYIWVLRENYIPAVEKAFTGHTLTEAQFTAALSFHYNTGAIGKADWVKLWKAGKVAAAEKAFMNWCNPPEIIPRREKERDLFFHGVWSQDELATVYPVKKPSYTPDWNKAKQVDISTELGVLL